MKYSTSDKLDLERNWDEIHNADADGKLLKLHALILTRTVILKRLDHIGSYWLWRVSMRYVRSNNIYRARQLFQIAREQEVFEID